MLNQNVQDQINLQINNEFYSSYSYLAMAAYCEHIQFYGCANWLRMQSQEEYAHAMRLYAFISDRGGRVELAPIDKPQVDFDGLLHVFESVLKQEQTVTEQINSLCELAFREKAFSVLVELEWFVKEQVEEEKSARDILHKFRLVKDDPASLLDLDRELAERQDQGDAAE